MIELFAPGFVYSFLKDIWAWFRGGRRKLTAAEILALRQKWKPLFDDEIWKTHSQNLRKDVVIRDVNRLESYPDVAVRATGISPWFRVGLMATYHKGIQVGFRWGDLTDHNGSKQWRITNYEDGEDGDLKVILMGFIPFENIQAVDWEGDEYYGYPHIFCYFDANKKEPYERKAFCVEKCNPGGRPFYMEVGNYAEIRKLSKQLGIGSFG